MVVSSHQFRPDELASVGTRTADQGLRALEVAIFLEEAVDVVLPDDVLDPEHLGSAEAVRATLSQLSRTN